MFSKGSEGRFLASYQDKMKTASRFVKQKFLPVSELFTGVGREHGLCH